MRICSLVPGATEVVAALGQAGQLVGISHECDFPASVRHATVLIEPLVAGDQISSTAIDQQVKTLVASGQRLYRLNEEAFAEARPDVILTQDLCHVCAVTPDQLTRAVRSLPSLPELLTLNPTTLEDILTDIERIGEAIGQPSEGRDLATSLRKRLAAVQQRSTRAPTRPRVLCLEWLSPLYIGGHWIPEMVDLAGGQDVLGQVRQPSHEATWEQVAAARPDIVILMPCGFSVDRTMRELASLCQVPGVWSRAIASWPKTFIVDAASYFSRPGPRLVDGVELLAALFSGTILPRFNETVVRALSHSSFL
jgi:iron complex transport system substrate-binding protein